MQHQNLEIRTVRANEAQALSAIASQTFIDTYGIYNTEQDMERYLTENFSLDTIKKQYKNPDSFFYFAEWDKSIVGYIKLNKDKAQTDSILENALEIERIYVDKNFQGKKIGNQFVQQAIAVARLMERSTIWLGVWDRNVKAVEFYLKNGFVEFGQHSFMLGSDLQNDTLMKFDLL